MRIQIFIVGGAMVEIDINLIPMGDVNPFVVWSKAIKLDGGIFSELVHVPYDKIAFLAPVTGDGPKINAPTTSTAQ